MTKSIYDLMNTDSSLETNGVWVSYGDYGRFLIARAGGSNARYLTAMLSKTKQYRKQLQVQMNSPDKATIDLMRSINIQLMAECILLNWEGVVDRLGAPLPYSKEAALQLLQDLPELYDSLQAQSTEMANFRNADLEADAKN